jgi:hypothetical protein
MEKTGDGRVTPGYIAGVKKRAPAAASFEIVAGADMVQRIST